MFSFLGWARWLIIEVTAWRELGRAGKVAGTSWEEVKGGTEIPLKSIEITA
jgi:hypothetical protein